MRILFDISQSIKEVAAELNTAKPDKLMLYARKLAMIELELQAARSMMEARMFQAEIDLMEAKAGPK